LLHNILSFPGIADPHIANGDRSLIAFRRHHVVGQLSFLLLVLVVKHKDGQLGLLGLSAQPLGHVLDILLELSDGVLERGSRVVDLVDDENVLANQVLHLQRRQVQPLRAGDLCADFLDLGRAQLLVQRQADGLDGDVRMARLLQKRAKDSGGDVTTAADGDDKVWSEGIKNLGSRSLTQLVDLSRHDQNGCQR